MNLSVILVAGALALATPVGVMTYQASQNAGSVGTASAASGDAQTGDLVVRIHHDGEPMTVAYELAFMESGDHDEDSAHQGPAIDKREMTLEEGETVFEYALEASGSYLVGLDAEDLAVRPLGIRGGQFYGWAGFDFSKCDAIEVLLQTLSRNGNSGLSVLGAQCMPGPARHVSVETSGPTVAFPYPTCPLNCGMEYGLAGEGRLEFDVPEGATSIEVLAHWSAESPFTREMSVWLTTPDAECGEECWMAVATETGTEQVTFTYDAPEPGTYSVSTHFTMPVAASLRQDAWLEAVVHTS